jgi:hypothetical protein
MRSYTKMKSSFNIKARKYSAGVLGLITGLNLLVNLFVIVGNYFSSQPTPMITYIMTGFYTFFTLLFFLLVINYNNILGEGEKDDPRMVPKTKAEKAGIMSYYLSGGTSPAAYLLNPKLGSGPIKWKRILLGVLIGFPLFILIAYLLGSLSQN